jgi:hypothetical protein
MSLQAVGGMTITLRNKILLLLALLLCAFSGHAQKGNANTGSTGCTDEIPFGVTVIRLPEAEQHKVTVSDFRVSANKDATTYDLAMRIKNGTDNWCITSLSLTYVLGDARGQAWLANEYPAVMEFKGPPDSPPPVKGSKAMPAKAAPRNVGMTPGQDEKRVVSDLYNYIHPRPTGYFDGFHVISGEIKYCMGYILTKNQ